MTNDENRAGTDPGTEEQRVHRTTPTGRTPVGRRDFLRGAAATGALALLGSAGAASAAAAPSWERKADQRIQKHRTGDLEVVVEDGNGNPVEGADVSVTMQSHDFHFGTAVNADMYVYGEDKNGNKVSKKVRDKYRRITHDLFNTAVLENAHKWKFWEDEQQRADAATRKLRENGMDVRGHVCIWGRTEVGAIPDDVLRAANNGNAEKIRERSLQHIEDIITHYGEDIMEWEVVNESMHTWKLQKGIYGDKINDEKQWKGEVVPWKSDIMADWYRTAAEATPEGVDLGINDFNVLTAEYDYAKSWYNAWANYIKESGVDLDFMGMQSHMKVGKNDKFDDGVEDRRLPPSQLMTDLDHFAQPTGSLRVTEFDFAQSDTSLLTQQEAADYFYKFLKTTFSHPAVDQFLMWGFWDKLHWSSPWSPLFDENFDKKPGYDVWTNLVFDQWWTDTAGTTGSSGTYGTAAFLGEHEVTATVGSKSTTKRVSVTDSDGTTTVTLTVDGSGTGLEPIVEGKTPRNVDSDPAYEDLNANGKVDFDDVVAYFDNMDEPSMTDHVDAYDYNGNGKIDFDDVVALFEDVQ